MNKSYTLIEVLVAVSIFTIIIAAPAGFLVGSLKGQQKALASQKLLDNTSYTLEYISRALRMAKKELSDSPTCLTECGRGCNYETNPPQNDSIKFIDYNEVCTEFFLENSQLKKRVGANTWNLTSNELEIEDFKVNLIGEKQSPADELQPRVTIFLKIRGGKDLKDELQPLIKIQTTISQRNLDVPY